MTTAVKFEPNRLLSSVSTFGIGGPAHLFAEVKSVVEMQEALRYCRERNLPYLVIGKGSNCLFDQQGYAGAVLLSKIDFCEHKANGVVHIGAGYSFSLLGTQTAREGFAGLEFASGIPGSVGGAVFMNAGANGQETCATITSVDYVHEEGQLEVLPKEKLTFSYRYSSFQQMRGAIVGATFQLTPSPTARQKQLKIISYRKNTQPLKEMSAGCIFRNPQCGHAGALIDQCGLKGFCVGGAKVSEMHANFIINTGTASSQDVLELIEEIKAKVKSKTGMELHPEVRYIPYK